MGISSNQARLMTLTARQHDLELRAQQISAQKMIKGLESQEAATDYSKALNNYSELKRIKSLPHSDNGYAVFLNNGVVSYRELRPDENPDDFDTYIQAGRDFEGLVDGWGSAFDALGFNIDGDVDIENTLLIAKAKYESFIASISAEEKLLDMELTQINTEHSAVKTEYDSVKGLIGENVDKSFNGFG